MRPAARRLLRRPPAWAGSSDPGERPASAGWWVHFSAEPGYTSRLTPAALRVPLAPEFKPMKPDSRPRTRRRTAAHPPPRPRGLGADPARHKSPSAGPPSSWPAPAPATPPCRCCWVSWWTASRRGPTATSPPRAMYQYAVWILLVLAGVYLVREALNVLRRYLVENTCTRLNCNMSVQLVAHLMKGDLAVLSQERVGALHGRILRSVDGFVRFLRVSFLDFVPAILTGVFALAAAVGKQPLLGLIMLGVIPTTLFLTIRQLLSQKGVRLELLRRCEEIDGTVVENMSGLEYVRAANTYAAGGPPAEADLRAPPGQGNPPPLSDVLLRGGQGAERGSLPRPRPGHGRLPGRQRPGQLRRRADLLDAVPQRDGAAERGPPRPGRGPRGQPARRRPAGDAEPAGGPFVHGQGAARAAADPRRPGHRGREPDGGIPHRRR